MAHDHIAEIVQRLTDAASSIIGAAYDTFAADYINNAWEVIATALSDTLDDWFEYGVIYTYNATINQTFGVTPTKYAGFSTSGLSSAGVTLDTINDRIVSNDPGTYIAIAVFAFSGTPARTFDMEVFKFTPPYSTINIQVWDIPTSFCIS